MYILYWNNNVLFLSHLSYLLVKNLNLYLFENNNTWLQMGHEVILARKNIGNSSLEKNPILLMPAVGFAPTTSKSLSGGVYS